MIPGGFDFFPKRGVMGVENDKPVFPCPPGVDRESLKNTTYRKTSQLFHTSIWRKEIPLAVKDASSVY